MNSEEVRAQLTPAELWRERQKHLHRGMTKAPRSSGGKKLDQVSMIRRKQKVPIVLQ